MYQNQSVLDENTSNLPFVIAIDGYSSCGKSTLAKQLAQALDFIFIDTGAMYRAVALYFFKNQISLDDSDAVNDALKHIDIQFKNIHGSNLIYLNGEMVESEIRGLSVSNIVSEVAAIPAVRRQLVALQRSMAGSKGLVMDGRDIGTVVFPDADLKIFVTADPIVRAQRRYNELIAKNEIADLQDVISNLSHRDHIDTTRADSPLVKADDAIILDNTYLGIHQQFEWVLALAKDKMNLAGLSIS